MLIMGKDEPHLGSPPERCGGSGVKPPSSLPTDVAGVDGSLDDPGKLPVGRVRGCSVSAKLRSHKTTLPLNGLQYVCSS
jgi:hypothetical protein